MTIPDEDLADGRAFLHTLGHRALSDMLTVLLPGVRIGEAGSGTWAAVDAIRSELIARSGGEADGTHGK